MSCQCNEVLKKPILFFLLWIGATKFQWTITHKLIYQKNFFKNIFMSKNTIFFAIYNISSMIKYKGFLKGLVLKVVIALNTN